MKNRRIVAVGLDDPSLVQATRAVRNRTRI